MRRISGSTNLLFSVLLPCLMNRGSKEGTAKFDAPETLLLKEKKPASLEANSVLFYFKTNPIFEWIRPSSRNAKKKSPKLSPLVIM